MSNHTSTKLWALRFVLFVVAAAAGVSVWTGRQQNVLQIWFADVGQGDGIILRTPNRDTIVVDGGPRTDFVQEVDSHIPITDRDIDLLVVTHADADHVTGLAGLVESGRVKNVLINRDSTKRTKIYQRLLTALENFDVHVVEAQAGQEFTFGDVRVRVLWPTTTGLIAEKEGNEKSIVLKVSYGEQDILLTGDASDQVEARLLEHGGELQSEVLKVGHHGSKSSTSESFVQAVDPDLAILSVGAKNRYGHPAQRVVDVLTQQGIGILRTDMLGDIRIDCTKMRCVTK